MIRAIVPYVDAGDGGKKIPKYSGKASKYIGNTINQQEGEIEVEYYNLPAETIDQMKNDSNVTLLSDK